MGASGKTSKISTVVAALCIIVYIAAIAFGAVRIFINMEDRKNLAESEFHDLADRATSSSVFMGFMSDAYQQSLKDILGGTAIILGVIVTGPAGEYAFERQTGSGITWTGNTPRLKAGAGFPREPFFMPLRIEGQRNVTIQAVYSYIDYVFIQKILKETLLAVLAALLLAFLVLIIEILTQRKPADASSADAAQQDADAPDTSQQTADVTLTDDTSFTDDDLLFDDDAPIPAPPSDAAIKIAGKTKPVEAAPAIQKDDGTDESPQGLYTPRGNIGWEAYTHDRLSSELHRCASFEQDLTIMAMEFNTPADINDDLYSQFAEEAVSFFTMRDLIFEKGEIGISIILPNTDLEHGIQKAEEFRERLISKMPESFGERDICAGLSSRSGRLIKAERLIAEAFRALEKALEDPSSSVIAFKSDPEKYREFIKAHH